MIIHPHFTGSIGGWHVLVRFGDQHLGWGKIESTAVRDRVFCKAFSESVTSDSVLNISDVNMVL